MGEQMPINTIEINEPQTAEKTAKRVVAYCDRLIHHASIVSEKSIRSSFLKDWKRITVMLFVKPAILTVILLLTARCFLSF